MQLNGEGCVLPGKKRGSAYLMSPLSHPTTPLMLTSGALDLSLCVELSHCCLYVVGETPLHSFRYTVMSLVRRPATIGRH